MTRILKNTLNDPGFLALSPNTPSKKEVLRQITNFIRNTLKNIPGDYHAYKLFFFCLLGAPDFTLRIKDVDHYMKTWSGDGHLPQTARGLPREWINNLNDLMISNGMRCRVVVHGGWVSLVDLDIQVAEALPIGDLEAEIKANRFLYRREVVGVLQGKIGALVAGDMLSKRVSKAFNEYIPRFINGEQSATWEAWGLRFFSVTEKETKHYFTYQIPKDLTDPMERRVFVRELLNYLLNPYDRTRNEWLQNDCAFVRSAFYSQEREGFAPVRHTNWKKADFANISALEFEVIMVTPRSDLFPKAGNPIKV